MKLIISLFACLTCIACPVVAHANPQADHPTLAIGAKAPDFNLTGTDGKKYSLASFRTARILVIVFTCNHCPTAQAYEDRLIRFTSDYSAKNVAVVAISPNDPRSIRLDELGYTDMSDSYDEMKERTKQKKFNYPYLYDGATQETAKAYGPVATPHVFIFDVERRLRYQGRFDDMEKPTKTPSGTDAKNAADALLAGKDVAVATTKVFGCSVKWADKSAGVKEGDEEWAKEKIEVKKIGEQEIKELLKNNTDKLRLINLWATWCGPCVTEFSQLVSINRMYRLRDFEFISISADEPSKQDKVLKFLKEKQAANTNYLFSGDSKYKLIEAIDPEWKGALPYTLLVEPGGKIVYRIDGPINPVKLKKAIVENRLIGRYY